MSIIIIIIILFSDIPVPTHRNSQTQNITSTIDIKNKNYNEKYGDHMKDIFSYESPTNNKAVNYNSPPRSRSSGNKTAVELIKEQMAKAKARSVNVFII